jgi:hypothetical protein
LFISDVLRPVEGGKMEMIPNSAGVYINRDEVSLLEFIKEEVSNG